MDKAADKILKEFQDAFKDVRKPARLRQGTFYSVSKAEAARIQKLRTRALAVKGDDDAAQRVRAVARATGGSFKAERYHANDGSFPLIDADEIWRVAAALWGKTAATKQVTWVL